ncbi:MAG: pantetheine-phosphate adenylyltransferase [bacterium]|nr:pantetheine-phosphate adenylyltransferase [bacterium]
MSIAICPGSFDPITKGHLDIIGRASTIFDKVIVAVAHNMEKKPLFTPQERIEFIEDALKDKNNIEIDSFTGLLVDYARKKNANAIIRGLRAVSDFEFEIQMALMNRRLHGDIVTAFMAANEKYAYLNSRIIKEIAQLNGDVSNFVTPLVEENLKKKFMNK